MGRERNFDDLIYRLQKQRLLHPMYIVFTKEGVVISALFLLFFYYGLLGLKVILLFAVAYWWVYRSRFDYRYSELEKVWLVSNVSRFLSQKIKKPFTTTPIIKK